MQQMLLDPQLTTVFTTKLKFVFQKARMRLPWVPGLAFIAPMLEQEGHMLFLAVVR